MSSKHTAVSQERDCGCPLCMETIQALEREKRSLADALEECAAQLLAVGVGPGNPNGMQIAYDKACAALRKAGRDT